MASKKWQPELVKASHVKQAAKYWKDQGSYAPFRNSRSYDVIVGLEPYPPKAIASKAHELATSRALKPTEFGGVKNGLWHRRLNELGFSIVEKASDSALAYDVSKSLKGSRAARLKRLRAATSEPSNRLSVTVTRFARNPDVVAERLYLADGLCSKCENPAPFMRSLDNTPYLEVHHIVPLSEEGPDTVENTEALCPNCHAEVHDLARLSRETE